jgi:hypothetical protein
MSVDKYFEITELLQTKFCHDMAGPIAALYNGMDFMFSEENRGEFDINDSMCHQAIELLYESSKQAMARLQTYRLAYGYVKVMNQSATHETIDILNRFFSENKSVSIQWAPDFPERINSVHRRILANLVLLSTKIAIYGGKTYISNNVGGGKGQYLVRITTDKLKDSTTITNILSGDNSEQLNVDNVYYYYLRDVAKDAQMKLKIQIDEVSNQKVVEISAEYE